MLKADEQETPRILCQIFQRIWDEEDTPDDWKTGTIIKLPKKGDLGNCNNWRGITLLSMTCKIFSRIILKRISAATDTILRQEQAGFRRGKSCIDHIFTLRQILEQSTEWNSTIYIAFIDFEKAFDSLHRESLWRILRHYGIPQKMVNGIKIIYTDVQCQVACNSHMSDSFSVKSGVKQGCILSPFLFTLAIDWLMIEITKNGNRGIRWTLTSILEDLDYADDIGLLSNRHKDMQEKMDKLTRTAPQIGLKLNTAKTKLMRINNKTSP